MAVVAAAGEEPIADKAAETGAFLQLEKQKMTVAAVKIIDSAVVNFFIVISVHFL